MSRAWMTACGSGARVNTTGMPSSRATSAAARLPTSAIRRCSTSARCVRSTRRIPRSAATRDGQACAAEAASVSRGTGVSRCPSAGVSASRASRAVPRERVSTRPTPGSVASASPSRTSSVATPPLSPAPARLRSRSMSACRKSWATVRPGPAPPRSTASMPRSIAASRATVPRSPSAVLRSRTAATAAASVGRSPRAATAVSRAVGCSPGSTASSSSARPAIGPGTRPRVSTSLLRTAGAGRPGQRTLEGERDLLRRGRGPSGERALGEDAGEPAAHDDPDQPADRVEAGQPGLERPARVLAQERPGVRQQLGQDGVGPVVEHPGEGVHGRHRGQLVALVDHRGEQPHRFRSTLAAGGGRRGDPRCATRPPRTVPAGPRRGHAEETEPWGVFGAGTTSDGRGRLVWTTDHRAGRAAPAGFARTGRPPERPRQGGGRRSARESRRPRSRRA